MIKIFNNEVYITTKTHHISHHINSKKKININKSFKKNHLFTFSSTIYIRGRFD